VRDHKESARLQYGLAARARALGWAAEQIRVIDDDQGHSGSEADSRRGFQALVAEVSLAHVGLILGSETARLARSNKDWHQLLELCALFGTLIADLEGIYDPAQYTDRLLLGLKGAMSEAELHILKQRMTQGRLSKARRGELALMVPLGYVARPGGEVTMDPDEQVQHIVRLVFRKFEELGTVNAVLRYLAQHHIEFGLRTIAGPDKGQRCWHRPARMTLYGLLTNPVYAGASVYGRRQIDPRHQRPGRPSTGRVLVDRRHGRVLLKDRLPAYISWEQYERNQIRLQANQARAKAMGAVRHGPALLAGVGVCGKWGARLFVEYKGPAVSQAYRCSRQRRDHGEGDCQRLTGTCLEQGVSEQVLAALAPAALELSLEAAQHVEHERRELDRVWQQRLERAGYEAEQARRRYHLTEPEHRLVARQLEREWEEKLGTPHQLQEAYAQFTQTQSRLLSETQRRAIRRLAVDLPS
jgi:DNA invertase Pin-like site-specific DNA recombinase